MFVNCTVCWGSVDLCYWGIAGQYHSGEGAVCGVHGSQPINRGHCAVNKIQMFIVKMVSFINEVGVELKKSAWPTRAELQESTFVVIMSVIALGVFVGLSDLILMRVLHLIL